MSGSLAELLKESIFKTERQVRDCLKECSRIRGPDYAEHTPSPPTSVQR